MKVELSLRGKWKLKLRGGGDFWWGHPFDRVIVPPPLFPSVACHSCLHFLSVCLPASPVCRSLSLLIQILFIFVRWQTGYDKKKDVCGVWISAKPVCLIACLSTQSPSSLRWPAHFTMLTDLACQTETLHSCSLPCWQTSPILRF